MPGSNLQEAFEHFARPIQAALHCVTPAKLARPRLDLYELIVLTFQHGVPVELQRATDNPRLFLDVAVHFQLVRMDAADDQRGLYHVETGGYMYTIRDNRRREIVSFHWDPRDPKSRPFPHLHIGASVLNVEHPHFRDGFSSLHIPTGRVTVEDIVQFLIDELQVRPSHQAWQTTIQATRDAHRMYRTSS